MIVWGIWSRGAELVQQGGGAEQGAEGPWRTHFVVEFAEAHGAYWGTNKMWNVTDADPTVDLEINPPWGPGCMTKVRCYVYNSMTKVGCATYIIPVFCLESGLCTTMYTSRAWA
jgi:hypothetical protein